MNQAIIGSGIDHAFDQWAFIHRDQGSVGRGGCILGDCIHAPDAAHNFQHVTVDIPAQVTADCRPAFPPVI